MEWSALQTWLSLTSMGVVAAVLFAAMAAAAAVGVVLRRRIGARETRDEGQEGYIVSANNRPVATLVPAHVFELCEDVFVAQCFPVRIDVHVSAADVKKRHHLFDIVRHDQRMCFARWLEHIVAR